MLMRKCAIDKLIQEGDFNVRLTVFNPAKCSANPEAQMGAWIETIRDSIGGGIVNSTDRIKLIIDDENGVRVFRGIIDAYRISEVIQVFCKRPYGIRISIAPAKDTSRLRSWIFV